MGVALEIEDRVDDVFEHAWAGDGAFLGHVTHQDHGDRALLGEASQLRGALADLGDASGRGFQCFRVHRLNRVDDDDFGLQRADRTDDRLKLYLGEQLDRSIHQPEAMRPQRNLLDGFFAGDVEAASRRTDRRRRLEQQRGLADSGIAAEQDHAACDKTAAEHPVEFVDARRRARIRHGLDA